MALQLVPLPYAVFVRLAPAADRFFREYQFGYADHLPRWHAVSLAPDSTLDVLLLYSALALLLVGLTAGVRRLVSLEWLVTRLIGFGVALAIFGAVQRSFEYRLQHVLIYGFWEPSRFGTPFGPFINRNHFAGWMVLAVPLAVGYAGAVLEMSRRPRGRDLARWLRWAASTDASRFLLVAFCIAAMGMSLVLTGSRSGIGSLAIALTVLAFFVARHVGGRMGTAVAAGLMLLLLVGAIVWAGAASTITRFALAASDVSGRLAVWRDALRIIGDFPWFGTGLGNFGLAMLVYQTGPRDAIYFQAHNDYLQLVAEGGLLVAAPAAAALWVFVRTVRRRLVAGDDHVMTFWIRAGAVAALAGIAAQSVLEFSLEIPAITILFVVIAAVAMHRSMPHHAHRV
jgi:O-antigen ligase